MDPQNIFLLVVAITNVFLGFVIYFHQAQKRDILNVLFSLLAFNVALWTFVMIAFRHSANADVVFFALTALYIIPVLIPVFFLYFVFMYTKSNFYTTHKKILIPFSAFEVLLLCGAVLSGNIVTGATIPLQGEKLIVFGSGYAWYVTHYLFFFGLSFVVLAKHFFEATSVALKNQIRNLFAGTFIASSISLLTNLFLPWFHIFDFNWVGNLMTIFFSGFIFYAVLRYRLFNLKVIATEVFVAFILTILVVELFFATNTFEFVARVFVFGSLIFFGILLIRGVYREVETRTEIERLAKDLRKANEQLKELDKRKSEFVSLASHELRSPLTAIKGYASMLLDGSFGTITESAQSAVRKIFESSNRLVTIVEDFLTISRIEQNRLAYNFTSFDFKDLVQKIVEDMRGTAQKKGLAYSFEHDTQARFMVRADSGKLAQVISNLIDNAIKYTPEGSVIVKLTTYKNLLRLSVADTGVGMSQETKEKIFSKFTRADNAHEINVTGAGLGLFIAKKLVEAHNGRIWAESAGEGKGSTFYVELPV